MEGAIAQFLLQPHLFECLLSQPFIALARQLMEERIFLGVGEVLMRPFSLLDRVVVPTLGGVDSLLGGIETGCAVL